MDGPPVPDDRRRLVPLRGGGARNPMGSGIKSVTLPQYSPMQPTLVPEPFHRPGWIYEEKVDGWQILAYKHGARVRLLSRNRVDHARRFREIAAAVATLPVP